MHLKIPNRFVKKRTTFFLETKICLLKINTKLTSIFQTVVWFAGYKGAVMLLIISRFNNEITVLCQ